MSEPLDELSKKTLRSYIKKAVGGTRGVATHAYHAGGNYEPETISKYWEKAGKRIKGIEMATDKLTKEDSNMSALVTHAQNKNAIAFKEALHERIQERVNAMLAETKIEVASKMLIGEGSVGTVSTVHKKPAIKGKPMMPHGKLKEGTENTFSFVSEDVEQLDEKIISPGSIEHMAHAVHACHSGHCEAMSHRGSFTQYNHPDYTISKDHGGVETEPSKLHYYVQGAGGMHKFSAEHTKNGVDVTHHGMVG